MFCCKHNENELVISTHIWVAWVAHQVSYASEYGTMQLLAVSTFSNHHSSIDVHKPYKTCPYKWMRSNPWLLYPGYQFSPLVSTILHVRILCPKSHSFSLQEYPRVQYWCDTVPDFQPFSLQQHMKWSISFYRVICILEVYTLESTWHRFRGL